MAPRYVSGDKWFLGIQSQGFLASHLSPWPPRFYAMAPWRPPWLFLLASSHHVLALSSHTGLAGHRAPGTHEACSQLITCAFSSVRSPFPPRSLYLLHHLSLSSHAIFPKRLLITQSNFQFKPTHPRSQHSHPVPALSSFWHVLWFEAILLVYLFTCLLRLSSPRQGEALSLLLGAGPKTRKSTCAESLVDEMAHPLPTPGPQPPGMCCVPRCPCTSGLTASHLPHLSKCRDILNPGKCYQIHISPPRNVQIAF